MNGSYIDLVNFSGWDSEAEGPNTVATLTSYEHTVIQYTTTDGATLSAFVPRCSRHPEQEIAAYTPNADAEAAFEAFGPEGGTLVVHGANSASTNFIN